MKRTGQQIVTDVISLIRGSAITSAINGGIYRGGTRPRDSQLEDLVVIFTNCDAEQFQEGSVTINIYVPYISNGQGGYRVENSARCATIESSLQNSIDAIKASFSNYLFSLRDAIHTQQDDEINQSFVVAHLGFKYFD